MFWKIAFGLTILICMNQDKQSLLSDISGRLHLDQQLSFASERGETESLPLPSDLGVYERVLGGGGYVSGCKCELYVSLGFDKSKWMERDEWRERKCKWQ